MGPLRRWRAPGWRPLNVAIHAARLGHDVAILSTVRQDERGSRDHPTAGPGVIDAIATWRPDWIVFGTIAQSTAAVRGLTERVIEACPQAERLYDEYRLFEFEIDHAIFGERGGPDEWPPRYTSWRSPAG